MAFSETVSEKKPTLSPLIERVVSLSILMDKEAAKLNEVSDGQARSLQGLAEVIKEALVSNEEELWRACRSYEALEHRKEEKIFSVAQRDSISIAVGKLSVAIRAIDDLANEGTALTGNTYRGLSELLSDVHSVMVDLTDEKDHIL